MTSHDNRIIETHTMFINVIVNGELWSKLNQYISLINVGVVTGQTTGPKEGEEGRNLK